MYSYDSTAGYKPARKPAKVAQISKIAKAIIHSHHPLSREFPMWSPEKYIHYQRGAASAGEPLGKGGTTIRSST